MAAVRQIPFLIFYKFCSYYIFYILNQDHLIEALKKSDTHCLPLKTVLTVLTPKCPCYDFRATLLQPTAVLHRVLACL